MRSFGSKTFLTLSFNIINCFKHIKKGIRRHFHDSTIGFKFPIAEFSLFNTRPGFSIFPDNTIGWFDTCRGLPRDW